MLNYGTLAKVKGNELDCYDWEDGDDLIILEVLDWLVPEYNVFLYKSYNIDKNEIGAVATHQFVTDCINVMH